MTDQFARATQAFNGPTTKELNQAVLIDSISTLLKVAESDLKSLQGVVVVKNDKIIRLEAENVRLKMTRTDAELQVQVDALRGEVGKKDRELVDLKRRLAIFQDSEKLTLQRAASAEQKILVMQTTMGTFQKARDAAYAETERHDRERLDAVRKMVDAADRAKKAEDRIVELENRGRPVAKNDNALNKLKKK